MIEFPGVPVCTRAVKNQTTPRVYTSHGGTETQFSGPKKLVFNLQVFKFHFSVFCSGCRIGQESLTGLRHGTKCSSTSNKQAWISSVKIRAMFWRGCVQQHITTVATFSTSAQILIKHYYIQKKTASLLGYSLLLNLFFGSSQTANWLLRYGDFKLLVWDMTWNIPSLYNCWVKLAFWKDEVMFLSL